MDVSLAAVLPQIFTGLVLGMLFVLLAIGLSLIFGLMTVVNFSQRVPAPLSRRNH